MMALRKAFLWRALNPRTCGETAGDVNNAASLTEEEVRLGVLETRCGPYLDAAPDSRQEGRQRFVLLVLQLPTGVSAST